MPEQPDLPLAPLPPWTLITSHGLALLYVAGHPDATIREIAEQLELTDRRIADVISDLVKAGLVNVTRKGRRNNYALAKTARFRHPLVARIPFQSFVALYEAVTKSSDTEEQDPS